SFRRRNTDNLLGTRGREHLDGSQLHVMAVLLAALFLFSFGISRSGDLNLVAEVRSQTGGRAGELGRLFVIHREHDALAVRSLPQASRHVVWLLRLRLLAGDAEPAP